MSLKSLESLYLSIMGRLADKRRINSLPNISAYGLISRDNQHINLSDDSFETVNGVRVIKAAKLGLSSTGDLITDKTIWVSKGSNATDSRAGKSKYNANLPFATIGAALSASVAGDQIILLSGEYAEAHLNLKDKVNIFGWGATIKYEVDEDFAILKDNNVAVTCRIGGALTIRGRLSSEDYSCTGLRTEHTSSSIKIESSVVFDLFNSIDAGNAIFCEGGTIDARGVRFLTYSTILATDGTVNVSGALLESGLVSSQGALIYANGAVSTNGSAFSVSVGGTLHAQGVVSLLGQISATSGGIVYADGASVNLVQVNGGTVLMSGGRVVRTTGSEAVKVYNSVNSALYFSGYIKITSTNGHAIAITGSSNNPKVVLYGGTTLVANGTGEAIHADAGTPTVKVYPTVMANKAVDSDLTQTIGTVTVNSAVE